MTARLLRPIGLLVVLGIAGCGGASPDAPTARMAPRSNAALAEEAVHEAKLATLEPAAVAPGDRDAYFDAVIDLRQPHDSDSTPAEPNPESLTKVLGLDSLVSASHGPLSGRVHEWLVRAGSDFAQAYSNEAAKVLASPPSSPWHRAEAGWVAWVSSHLTTLTEQELYGIGLQVFMSPPDSTVQWFPGLDRFAYCLAVADAWIRAGHPGLRDHYHPAAEAVVCSVEDDYGKLSSLCEDHAWWYRTALKTDADTQRLTQAVLAHKDPMLTRAVALGIGLSPKTLEVLHAWEQDPGTWHDALLVIAREDDWRWMRDWLMPEMKRVWAAHPSWRGAILYALAMACGPFADNGPTFEVNVAFDHFARDFAGGVTREDFGSFLDQAPRAIELAQWMMPDRAKGWSVADAVLPKLDAYFALPPDVPADSPRGPGFPSVVGHMCYTDHDLAGLAKLKAYFDKRAPAHPGDKLNLMMEGYGPKECHAR